MKSRHFAKWVCQCSFIILIQFGATGCGSQSSMATADQDEAKTALDQVLTSWQSGKTIEDLKNDSPSIIVSDPKWARGDKLKKYTVNGAGKASGAERSFTVNLWLTSDKGKEVREQVQYRVGTHPVLTVFRALFD